MNVGDLGKLIAAEDFKKLPKVQKIAKSGHTDASSLARFNLDHVSQVRMTFKMESLLDLVHRRVLQWRNTMQKLCFFV